MNTSKISIQKTLRAIQKNIFEWSVATEITDLDEFEGYLDQLETIVNTCLFEYRDGIPYKEKSKTSALLKTYESICQVLHEINVVSNQKYFALKADIDRKNISDISCAIQRVKNKLHRIEEFINHIPAKNLSELSNAGELSEYKHYLEKKVRLLTQIRPVDEEKLIEYQGFFSTNLIQKIYSEVINKIYRKLEPDKKFNVQEKYSVDSKLLDDYYRLLEEDHNIFYILFSSHFANLNNQMTIRNYRTALSTIILENNIDIRIVENVCDTVKLHYPVSHKYFVLKAKYLGIYKFEISNLYMPLGNVTKKKTSEYIYDLILKHFSLFNPEFFHITEHLISNGLIHLSQEKKTAVCYLGTSSLYPHIFINSEGTTQDILYIAHELGHAIGSVLAMNQSFFNFFPAGIFRESNAVFCELLIFDALYSGLKNEKEKTILTCTMLDHLYALIFKKIINVNWEKECLKLSAANMLTGFDLNRLWESINSEVYGDAVTLLPRQRMDWINSSINLAKPFASYNSLQSALFGLILYHRYKSGNKSFSSQYINFLKMGSFKAPAELAEIIDIDLDNKDIWKEAFVVLAKMLRTIETENPV